MNNGKPPCDECSHVISEKPIKPVKIGGITVSKIDLGFAEIWINGWGVQRPTGFQAFECDRKELKPDGWDLENHVLCYDERKSGYLMSRILKRCGKEGRFFEPQKSMVVDIIE